ncbi:hypothetical protein IE53DRAFT_386251 [Violaceomyces palustris]|uniref:Uncharacterized protein n=1 Tax=Violaceomyces palustris TaxID=1673888 RepID=A0ACD0P060_9BASI|nr:hypothetical protein IE53DRAFT_386251 [Violaceomyces palustris]
MPLTSIKPSPSLVVLVLAFISLVLPVGIRSQPEHEQPSFLSHSSLFNFDRALHSNSSDPYNSAGTADREPQKDGRHEIRFSLMGCPSNVKPKISGVSTSKQEYVVRAPGILLVPADFMGNVYLTGEACGKHGDLCQSVDLTFKENPTETVRSYINYDGYRTKKFLYPVVASFDDDLATGQEGTISCDGDDCPDASRDPDDFISNRIYSSTKGVGVDVTYDCTA